MKFKPERKFYIPKDATEIRDPESSAVAYLARYRYRNNGANCFQAVAFSGKRNKPDWNYTFRTDTMALEYIAKHAANHRAFEAQRAKEKAERFDFRAADHFKVGDMFHTSWGYDQTNCEFFKITRVLEKSVEVVRIGADTVPGSEGYMCCRLTPNPDHVLTDKYDVEDNGIKRCYRRGDSVGFSIHKYSSAYPIKLGESAYRSWYA